MDVKTINQKYQLLKSALNERSKRIFAAVEANAIGRGGIQIVSQATGLNRNTIARGIKELGNKTEMGPERIRRPGAGRKKILDINPKIKANLESLIEPYSRGDPEPPLRWTTKSLRKLSSELEAMNNNVSHEYIAYFLRSMKYSLQGNRKTKEGGNHPDRNAQFEYISRKVKAQQKLKDPVVSVDAKKKEIIGSFKNPGREWRPKGSPEEVQMHDFVIKKLGKVCPYGVYDLVRNEGWISVGIDHDTAEFAVNSISRWWKNVGKQYYPHAKELLICSDCGWSNGNRNKLWKYCLQKFAKKNSLKVSVCHYPPGTSKWNKIEHKMFSFISMNWKGKPLTSYEVIINLIQGTRTDKGLKIKAKLDKRNYKKGKKILEEAITQIRLKEHSINPEWNYTILNN